MSRGRMEAPIAAMLMAAAMSGCSQSSAPAQQTEMPPATASAMDGVVSSATPVASSSMPPAAPPASDGGFGIGRRPREHMFLADYRSALRIWMTPEEQARAATVDTSRTDGGSAVELALLGADCAVRVISPLALEARGFHDEARTLRGLAPIGDWRTAGAAAAALEPLEKRTEPPETEAGRPLGLEKPLAWSRIELALVLQGPRVPPSGVGAAMAAGAAVREGAPRAAVVDAVVDLLQRMAAAARAKTR